MPNTNVSVLVQEQAEVVPNGLNSFRLQTKKEKSNRARLVGCAEKTVSLTPQYLQNFLHPVSRPSGAHMLVDGDNPILILFQQIVKLARFQILRYGFDGASLESCVWIKKEIAHGRYFIEVFVSIARKSVFVSYQLMLFNPQQSCVQPMVVLLPFLAVTRHCVHSKTTQER
jgi:hypothetical protein